MNICRLHGEELQKSQSNTFEDYFNRSEVTYRDGGEERTLSVLYLRHFETALLELLPYEGDPPFAVNGRDIYLLARHRRPRLLMEKPGIPAAPARLYS